jgi:hypothetical protein
MIKDFLQYIWDSLLEFKCYIGWHSWVYRQGMAFRVCAVCRKEQWLVTDYHNNIKYTYWEDV